MLKAHKESTIVQKNSRKDFLFSTIFCAIISMSVIGINFLFFINKNQYNIFAKFSGLNQEFIWLCSGIIISTITIAFLTSFSKLLQCLITSIIFATVTYAFMHQLGMGNITNALSPHFKGFSAFVIPFIIGIMLLAFLEFAKLKTKLYFSIIMLCLLLGSSAYTYYKKPNPPKQLQTNEVATNQENKIIYISINNYLSFEQIKKEDEESANMIVDFFNNNNFSLHPNSYQEPLTESFNEIFKKQGYNITSYQNTPCPKNIDNCITNNEKSLKINKREFNAKDKTKIIISAWVNSFSNTNIPFLNNKKYTNINNINSLKTLEEAFKNIKNSSQKGIYYINLEMPNNYIYDQYCNIKQPKHWHSNQNGLSEQNKCIFAKLQELFNKTKTNNTVYIITFGNQEHSTFALFDQIANQFNLDNRACSNKDFFSNYLFKKNDCNNSGVKTSQTNITISPSKQTFQEWFSQYKRVKNID